MKINLKKISIILAVTCHFIGMPVINPTHSRPVEGGEYNNAEQLKARITREEFAEFHDILIIENKNVELEIEDIYFSNFDLNTGVLNYDEIFSVKSPEFKPEIFTGKQKETVTTTAAPEYKRSNINNIALSGSKTFSGQSKVQVKTSESNLFKNLGQSEFRERLKKAAKLIKTRGEPAEIQQALVELETIADNKAENLSNIAKLHIRAGNMQKACGLLEKAETLAPEDFKVVYTHAVCLYKYNKFIKAEEKLKKVVSLNPDFMYAYYNLGNIYYKNKDYNKAIDFFKKAMELAPGKANVYFNIALTLEQMNYTELAKKFYSKCLEIDPLDKEALKALENLN